MFESRLFNRQRETVADFFQEKGHSVEKRIDDDKVTIVDNGDKKIKESLEKND